ncbi:hypothetical protein [Oceanicoccus sagamiensis]|uniref:Uncharacterized protein n=1 Tax=Oceanicoccus sagamiensis TaxID=716816 RepID=A0A1X9NH28_9GAMM|nr:hypothetical protein [Oceanicoccus sagamiensis]ARN75702.1 hypothetical protein BST96_17265 [Oceanicoccus sagamiensis]
MTNDAIISSDQGSGRVAPTKSIGWYANWGPQAWIDMWMSNSMLVKKGMNIVSHTYLPILRLSGDPEQINRDYLLIRNHREQVKLLDSPREKWRKRYGNFVRECEWCLLELRKYYPQKQYEELVIGLNVDIGKETSADFFAMMNSMSDNNKNKKKKTVKNHDGSTKPGKWATFLFETFNPAHWLTGPATITEYDPGNGLTVMEIPDCGWHTCAKADTLPNPDALPQEGCLLICKGPFEAMFKGENGG